VTFKKSQSHAHSQEIHFNCYESKIIKILHKTKTKNKNKAILVIESKTNKKKNWILKKI